MNVHRLEMITLFRKGVLNVENIRIMMDYYLRANDQLGSILSFPKIFKIALPQLAGYKVTHYE